MPIDIARHLENENYPASTQLRRVAWGVGEVLFHLLRGPVDPLRNQLLRSFGARVGRGVRIHPSVRIMFPWNLDIADQVIIGEGVHLYALAPIVVEHDVLISQRAHLCAGSHDHRQPHFPIAHAPIRIMAGTWIAAEAFIGPGVTVGAGSVVGARAVVMRDLPSSCVAWGNPAQVRPLGPSA